MRIAILKVALINKFVCLYTAFTLLHPIFKLALICRLNELMVLIFIHQSLDHLSMRHTVLKLPSNLHFIIFSHQQAFSLKLRIPKLSTVIWTICKYVNTVLMPFGVDECTRLALLEEPFIVRKVRIHNSPISVRLAVGPVALINRRLVEDKIYRTVLDNIFNSCHFF